MILSSRRTSPAAVLAASVAVIFALAGCSGAPAGTEPSPTAGADAPEGNAGFQAARDAYDLKLAQCLRDAGFDVKDPAPGEGITEFGNGIEAAASVCMKELGDPPTPNATVNQTEMLDAMLVWAQCLRDRGLEVEEPKLGQAFFLPVDATDEDVAACIDPV